MLHNSENRPKVPVDGISHVERAEYYSVMELRGGEKSKSPQYHRLAESPSPSIPHLQADTNQTVEVYHTVSVF